MNRSVLATCFGVVAALIASATGAAVPAAAPGAASLPPPPCVVTRPNGIPSPVDHDPGWYGNDALATQLWMWGEGAVPVPPDHVQPDGSFGPLKWGWYRYVRGELTVEGRRLDAPSPSLKAQIPAAGYEDGGFLPIGITFPTGGCWQVTGRVGEASLTFVTFVAPAKAFETPTAMS